MRQDIIIGYRKAKRIHEELYKLSTIARSAVNTTDTSELANLAYGLDQTIKYLDDARKELQKVRDLAEKTACAIWAATSQDGKPIRTDYVTATPEVRQAVRIPKRDTDPAGYAALMRHLGVPEEMIAGEDEVLRPHWPGFVAHISRLAEQGKPLPDGVDPNASYPVYTLTLRGKKEVGAP